MAPVAGPGGCGRLPELPRGPGKLDVSQSGRLGQSGFPVSHFDEGIGAFFDQCGVALEEISDVLNGKGSQRMKGVCCGIQGCFAISPGTDRVVVGERLTGGRIFSLEGAGGVGGSPFAGQPSGRPD